MRIQLTYKYRIYPTAQQEETIRKTFGCVRYVYNKLLEDRTKHYRETGRWKKLDLSSLKDQKFLDEVDQGALTWAQSRLENAYRNFFYAEKNKPDIYRPESLYQADINPNYKLMDTDLLSYPRFKKKKSTRESYTTPIKHFEVQSGRFSLRNIGSVKIHYHRPIPADAEIYSCTVLRKRSGRYYLLITFYVPEPEKREKLESPLGVAFVPGVPAIRSDEVPVQFRHQDEALQKQIEKAYKTLKRRKVGSARYEKQRKYLASLYEHRANQRRDDLHKAARQIANAGDAIYVQKPEVRARMKNMESEKEKEALLDEGTWTLFSLVRYKVINEGKQFWPVPKEFPIYSICSACDSFSKTSTPEGNWKCEKCGCEIDRNLNAARNMRNLGIKYIQELKA